MRRPPRSTRMSPSFPTRRSSDLVNPVNRFGSSMSLGNAVFGVENQTINFENDLPVISYEMYPGIDPLDAAMVTPTGNAFRNAYFRNRITRSEEHTSELQSLMRISYAVFSLKKKKTLYHPQ